jgi:hypothetical protein
MGDRSSTDRGVFFSNFMMVSPWRIVTPRDAPNRQNHSIAELTIRFWRDKRDYWRLMSANALTPPLFLPTMRGHPLS